MTVKGKLKRHTSFVSVPQTGEVFPYRKSYFCYFIQGTILIYLNFLSINVKISTFFRICNGIFICQSESIHSFIIDFSVTLYCKLRIILNSCTYSCLPLHTKKCVSESIFVLLKGGNNLRKLY